MIFALPPSLSSSPTRLGKVDKAAGLPPPPRCGSNPEPNLFAWKSRKNSFRKRPTLRRVELIALGPLQTSRVRGILLLVVGPPSAAQFCRCVCRSFRLDSVRLWRVGRGDVHCAMCGVCRIGEALMGPLIWPGSTRRHRRQGAETWRRKYLVVRMPERRAE